MKRIALNCEPVLAAFMNAHTGSTESFQSGRGVAVLDCDDEARAAEIIAGVWFDGFNGANMFIHVAALPGRAWLSRKLLSFVFNYAFTQCKVRRLTGLVAATNVAARSFDEHLGFVREACLRDAAPDGDLLVYVMHRSMCRWLALTSGIPPLMDLPRSVAAPTSMELH